MDSRTVTSLPDLWNESHATGLTPVERLIYRSQLLGSELRITNTGGGNTSSKVTEIDPLTGRPAEVLWVKGSGGDLRSAVRTNFASLDLNKVRDLERIYRGAATRGPKSAVEDRIVGLYAHCTFNLNPCAPSIDTPLHAFIPARHVDHTHPISVIAVAAAPNGPALTHTIFGSEVEWVDWQRPGFDLGLIIRDRIRANPALKGVVLGKHGLINWADDDRECYRLSLRLINQAADFIARHDKGERAFGGLRVQPMEENRRQAMLAELLPWLRGKLSGTKRVVATCHCDAQVMSFVDSVDAARLAGVGTSCPDHFLRTKIKPLLADWDPHHGDIASLRSSLTGALESYRTDYGRYYSTCRHADSPAMRDASPTVILVPGLGLIAWGKNKSEARITAEFYRAAIEVMRGAEAIDSYSGLPQQEAFDIEYWLLEEAKLRRQPAEKELARRVCVVIGAASGIGKTVATRLAQDGAHVVCADLSLDAARQTATELAAVQGPTLGDAGTRASRCEASVGLAVDLGDRASIRSLMRDAVLAYGGIDTVVITAGVYVAPDESGEVTDEQWQLMFNVNVRGAYWTAREAAPVWSAQGLTGSLVLTTSVNAVVAKKGSIGYDLSKAAAGHLVRELAVELAPLVRVNGLAPATVIGGSSMFPRDRVIASLRKYGLSAAESESTEDLRQRLAAFYAQRTLLKAPVTVEDQAAAVYFLVSERSAKTTGQTLSVDGGLTEAFLR